MHKRLDEFLKKNAEHGCEHCTHKGEEGCRIMECWKLTDQHFIRAFTKLFAQENIELFKEEHE